MKVLWFTSFPFPELKKRGTLISAGGWIQSELNALKEFQPSIQLGIVFLSEEYYESFEYKGTYYFPVRDNSIKGLLKILFRSNINKSNFKVHKKLYLEIINKYKPQLIHIHGTEYDFGTIITSVNVPVVVSIQGILTVYTHKYFSGISKKFVTGLSIINNRFIFQYNNYRHLSIIERKTLKNVKYVFGRTDWDKRVSSILAPVATYFHIDEVIRDVFYQNEWLPQNRSEKILVTTLRDNLYKGFEVILETACLLRRLNIRFKWKVIGLNFDSQIVKLLKKKYETISENMVLEGKLNAREIVILLKNADIYIQTSHIENSPNSLAEAMILGMPVIATFAGGTSSLLTDHKDGILIQDGDPWSMAGAILELWNNRELAFKLGQEARKRAIQRHDPEKISKSILLAYKQILKDHQ